VKNRERLKKRIDVLEQAVAPRQSITVGAREELIRKLDLDEEGCKRRAQMRLAQGLPAEPTPEERALAKTAWTEALARARQRGGNLDLIERLFVWE
jgi:hypothetical protein